MKNQQVEKEKELGLGMGEYKDGAMVMTALCLPAPDQSDFNLSPDHDDPSSLTYLLRLRSVF